MKDDAYESTARTISFALTVLRDGDFFLQLPTAVTFEGPKEPIVDQRYAYRGIAPTIAASAAPSLR